MEINKSSFCCKNLVEKKRRKRKEWAGKKEKDEGKTEPHDFFQRFQYFNIKILWRRVIDIFGLLECRG